jgi:DNA-binding LytR/AlgR family response regulator
MIKYLIVEDERFAYEEMKRMISRLRPDYELIARTESVEDTVSFLRKNTVDLILMDIRLADGSCFEVFEQVPVSTPIIFTTAYDEYAIRAFKVNSIDYLLKPIEEADLLTAFDKYEQMQASLRQNFDYKKLEEVLMQNHKRNRIMVQSGDNYYPIETANIAFIYSEDKVVFIHTFPGKRYIVDHTLSLIEQQLDRKLFFRVSRNCIANIHSIKKISKHFNGRLKLNFLPDCLHDILVSRERVPEFLKWIDGM